MASALDESSSALGAGAGGPESGVVGTAGAVESGGSGAAGGGGFVAGGYRVTVHAAATRLCAGFAIGPDDSVWVGHGQDADANPHAGSLRITKLAP